MADDSVDSPAPDNYGPTSNPAPGIGQATIDAPPTNKSGTELLLEAKSVKHVGHAWNICRATEQANRTRSARTADIQSLHDGAPPRSSQVQAEKAKSWQSNASTNWLSGIVGRVAQRFVNAIISQKYITASCLPSSIPDWKPKTDALRGAFTTLVRSWNGYTGLINSECVETALQGYCYAVFLDPYTWKPTFFKQDWAFVPEYSGQHARDFQFFVAKMDYRLDEFIALFANGEDTAEEVGYNVANCVAAANSATIANPPEDATTTQFRTFVEMINEGVLGLTYTAVGPRIVKTYLLFNREYDGKVSFWLVARDSGKLLRFSHKLFPSMEDAVAAFSFEPGNGCIHSSKGLGRKLANLAVIKEIFRNGIIDNSRMSGMPILKADSADRTKFNTLVSAPFIVIDKSIDLTEIEITANADAYKTVDVLTDVWAEQSVGTWIKQPLDVAPGGDKTATEAQIEANQDAEAANIQIRRQLDQFATMTQIQQLRAFSDDNIAEARLIYDDIVKDREKDTPEIYGRKGNDAEVMRVIVEVMASGITDDEIKIWRKSPVSNYAHVSEAALQQGLELVGVENAQAPNPNIDQARLTYRRLENKVGPEEASKLFIPKPDETVVAEATRAQEIETNTMNSSGRPLPASARDNHLVHGATIQKFLTDVVAPVIGKGGAITEKVAELNLNHLAEHLQFAQQDGSIKNPAMQEIEKFYEGFKGQLEEVVQIRAAAKASTQAVVDQVRAEDGTAPAVAPSPQPGEVAPFELPAAPTVEPVAAIA